MNNVIKTSKNPLLIFMFAAIALTVVFASGCVTDPPKHKHYAAVLVVSSDGIWGQWATNNHALQALDQSFTKVLINKGYSVCPLSRRTSDSGNREPITGSVRPEELDQLAIAMGKEAKVEFIVLAVLNQATVRTGNNDEIQLNIVSKMFRIGNDYAPNEIVASHEWPEGGIPKPILGGSDNVVAAVQSAAINVATRYPQLRKLLPGE